MTNVNNNAAVWFEVYSKDGESCFQEITPVIEEMEGQWGLVGFFNTLLFNNSLLLNSVEKNN